ncbi:MAG: hypothetical protein JW820_18935, partial [Spirochaetales bacterium]|nr:hypothetical protein [Spirochaetales bacterium]
PELADFLWALAGGAAAAAAACAFVYDQAPGNEPSLLGAPLACFGLVLAIPVADSWCRSRLRARRSRGY